MKSNVSHFERKNIYVNIRKKSTNEIYELFLRRKRGTKCLRRFCFCRNFYLLIDLLMSVSGALASPKAIGAVLGRHDRISANEWLIEKKNFWIEESGKEKNKKLQEGHLNKSPGNKFTKRFPSPPTPLKFLNKFRQNNKENTWKKRFERVTCLNLPPFLSTDFRAIRMSCCSSGALGTVIDMSNGSG